MSEETITISKDEYDKLLANKTWLQCLEAAGVDNWTGYSFAQEMLDEIEGHGADE